MKFKSTVRTTILDFLIANLKLGSTTKARKLLKLGEVHINRKPVVRADSDVLPGDTVEVVKSIAVAKKKAPFEILYQDDDVLVAVKPAGLLSVNRENQDSRTFHKIINEYVREVSSHKERVFVVHRLDREVSGAMIFAKSLEIQGKLEEAWKSNDKIYYALVEGRPPQKEGRIESWLAENAALKVFSTKEGPEAKHAVTHYRVVKEEGAFTLIEVRLETGRKNQIRVHMADLGCPIVGDLKYGAKTELNGRIALHAFRFAFNHPNSGKRISLEAPLPQDFEKLLSKTSRGRAR